MKPTEHSQQPERPARVGWSAWLDDQNPRHISFLNIFSAGTREYVRKHYREVAPGVYESDAPPLSNFHQKLARLIVRPLYGVFPSRRRRNAFRVVVNGREWSRGIGYDRLLRQTSKSVMRKP